MGKPRGVNRRFPKSPVNFEMRFGDGKLYSTSIETEEVGKLCYDIAQRYLETVGGSKRKAGTKLNYGEYSRSLQLLRPEFDILGDKGAAMEFILKQAKAAAKNLNHCASGSGCQTPSNQSSSHQRVHDNLVKQEVKQESPGVCTNSEFQKGFQAEHAYKSEEPRKKLEDHDLESISGSLMGDGNQMMGRQRVNEKERFPQLLEDENLADEYSIDWTSPFFILDGPEFRLPPLVNSTIWS